MIVYKMFLVHISWLMDSNLCNNISLMCSVIMYAGRAVPGEDEAAAPRQHPVPEVGAAAGDQTSICWERKGAVPCTESDFEPWPPWTTLRIYMPFLSYNILFVSPAEIVCLPVLCDFYPAMLWRYCNCCYCILITCIIMYLFVAFVCAISCL